MAVQEEFPFILTLAGQVIRGKVFEVTFTIELVPIHPLVPVTVTLYGPAVFALIVWLLPPFDHEYELYPEPAFNMVDDPGQIIKLPVIDGAGFGNTLKIAATLDVEEHTPALLCA